KTRSDAPIAISPPAAASATQPAPSPVPATATPAATPTPTPPPSPTAAPAPPLGVVTGDLINLRSGPDTGYAIVGQATVSQTLQITGRNQDHSWWQVCCLESEGEQGWIFAEFLQPERSAEDTAAAVPVIEFPPTLTGVASRGAANLRGGPGTGYPLTGEVSNGETVRVVGRNEAGTWWQICCPTGPGNTSWIYSLYLVTNFSPAEGMRRLPVVAPPPLPTPTRAPSPAVTATVALSATGVITGDIVNLRGGPGTGYPIAGAVTLSQTVRIVGQNRSGDWWQICCSGDSSRPAWVSAQFVQTSAATATRTAEPADAAATPPAEPAPDAVAAPAPNANSLPGPGNFAPPGATNPLTGLPLPAEQRTRRPVIVCVNNDAAARPQYGLGQADVGYEYLMEGYGITRFGAIFYGHSPARIGPIRSARLINYYMGALYNAPLFCSGASDHVRYLLKNEAPFPYLDIDLDDPSNARYSDSTGSDYRTRLSATAAGLRRWLSDWDIEAPARVRGFTFGPLPAGGQPAASIDIPYPDVTGSDVRYTFTPAAGRYLRFMGGLPHTDAATGIQLAVENVVIQVVAHQKTDMVEDSLGSTGIRLNLFGEGRALIFRDGAAFEATWRSQTQGDTPRFFGPGGTEIPLKPGQTWISIVPERFEVQFK
ncbi:MAG: DUF3048 domain-containing protein, partial [Anaerolineae bacterium]